MNKMMNLSNAIEVLIVEDETVLALGMQASLEDLGYEVLDIQTTALNAIKYANENLPDIVIMDIKLKGSISGIEAAKQIWKTNKIPIVFLTSYSDDITIKNAMDSEPYAYLLKPCRDKELDIVIKTTLHKHKYFFKNIECLNQDSVLKLINDYSYDNAKRILYYKDESIKLTGNEIKFFDILVLKVGESVSFERIISYIYRDDTLDIGKLRTLVYRLRGKLEVDLFENVYEFGYRIKLA